MKSTSRQEKNRNTASVKLTDDDIYMIMMLHQNQNMSSRDIARKFGISIARVRDIVARRTGGSCCG